MTKSCDLRYDFCIKRCSFHLYPQLCVWRHIFQCGFLSSCVPYVASFSGLSILIAPSVFSNVYLCLIVIHMLLLVKRFPHKLFNSQLHFVIRFRVGSNFFSATAQKNGCYDIHIFVLCFHFVPLISTHFELWHKEFIILNISIAHMSFSPDCIASLNNSFYITLTGALLRFYIFFSLIFKNFYFMEIKSLIMEWIKFIFVPLRL